MKDYETIEEVHRMHEASATPTEIGNALSLPRSTVASILRRPIPKSTADRIIVRCVSNGGWSTANHCVSYIAMPRIRTLEAANDNFERHSEQNTKQPGAIAA